jgi:hypothetical protein
MIQKGEELITTIVNKVAPDANIEVQGKITQALQMQQNEYNLQLAQLDINKVEAQSPSIFIAGGRPFYIWVGGIGMAYQLVFMPIVNGVLLCFGLPSPFQPIDTGLLLAVVGSLLGFNGTRTFEKLRGIDTKRVIK